MFAKNDQLITMILKKVYHSLNIINYIKAINRAIFPNTVYCLNE
jgi:hypothetical protein